MPFGSNATRAELLRPQYGNQTYWRGFVQADVEREYLLQNWHRLRHGIAVAAVVSLVFRIRAFRDALADPSGVPPWMHAVAVANAVFLLVAAYSGSFWRGERFWRAYVGSGAAYAHNALACISAAVLTWTTTVGRTQLVDVYVHAAGAAHTVLTSLIVAMIDGVSSVADATVVALHGIAAAALTVASPPEHERVAASPRLGDALAVLVGSCVLTLSFAHFSRSMRRRAFAAYSSLAEQYCELRTFAEREAAALRAAGDAREHEAAAAAATSAHSLMINFLGHQIRNPLHVLLNIRAEMGDNPSLGDPLQPYLAQLDGALARLRTLCDTASAHQDMLHDVRGAAASRVVCAHALRDLGKALQAALQPSNLRVHVLIDHRLPRTLPLHGDALNKIFTCAARWLARCNSSMRAMELRGMLLAAPQTSRDRLRSSEGIVTSNAWLAACVRATRSMQRVLPQPWLLFADLVLPSDVRPTERAERLTTWQWWLHVELRCACQEARSRHFGILVLEGRSEESRPQGRAGIPAPAAADMHTAWTLATMLDMRVGLFDVSLSGGTACETVFFVQCSIPPFQLLPPAHDVAPPSLPHERAESLPALDGRNMPPSTPPPCTGTSIDPVPASHRHSSSDTRASFTQLPPLPRHAGGAFPRASSRRERESGARIRLRSLRRTASMAAADHARALGRWHLTSVASHQRQGRHRRWHRTDAAHGLWVESETPRSPLASGRSPQSMRERTSETAARVEGESDAATARGNDDAPVRAAGDSISSDTPSTSGAAMELSLGPASSKNDQPVLAREVSAGSTASSALVSAVSGATSDLMPTPAGRPLVLVVDDELVNRRLNARLLQRLGIDAELAADGPDVTPALEAAVARGRAVDAILLDIVMVREHGDTVCERLRATGCNIPIIAATGNAAPADIERYAQAGFNAVLTKPFTVEQLQMTLAGVGISPEICR